MCAIAGIVSVKPVVDANTIVERMLAAMQHRGPDDRQIVSFPQATIGHNRLSILDLSDNARQPMVNSAGDLVISFNGEIYNYRELRQLLGNGLHWRSTSDTEVLLNWYARQELNCIDRLNGIFAFAVWDQRTQRLVLVRDHMGVKPLYWYQAPGWLIFASELKGILASGLIETQINPEAVHHYLSIQAIPPPLTMIQGVHLLEAGSYLTWQQGEITQRRYFSVKFGEDDTLGPTITPYIDQAKTLLAQAVSNQRQADVPVGIALSGGIDSSLILSELAVHQPKGILTYTLTDDSLPKDVLDDGYYAEIVSKQFNSDHTELYLKPYELLEALPAVIAAQDQPSLRNMLAYFLFRKIKHQVKVLFYGSGGDELFAGYGTMKLLHQFYKRGQFFNGATPLAEQIFKLFPGLYRLFPSADYTFKILRADTIYRQRQVVDWIFLDNEKISLYHPTFQRQCSDFSSERYFAPWANGKKTAPIKVHQQLDWLGMMTEHLTQLDAVAMANGIETRVPFVDKNVVTFAAQLPSFVLAPRGVDNKHILRQAYRTSLPLSITERPKTGFHISFQKYMSGYFQPLCQLLFSESRVRERQLWSYSAIQRMMIDYFHQPVPRHNTFEKLSLLVNLEVWMRLFVDGRNLPDLTDEIVTHCTLSAKNHNSSKW